MTYSLISWGANSHGQLGHGIECEESVLPREVDLSNCLLEPQKIKKIAGGAGHTLLLDDCGRVYACGLNSKGQAGFPEKENILSFRELNGKLDGKIVVDIACGWDCSAALTIEGTLFLWGSNKFGQLGKHPSDIEWTTIPFETVIDQRIKRISIGLRHTALITQDHKMLVAGAGSRGQLGLGVSCNKEIFRTIHTFTEVPGLTNIEDVSCGQHHVLAVTRDGNFYAFGDNKYGQLGLNTELIKGSPFPTKLSSQHFKLPVKIWSGWSHVILLNGDQVFCWGRNTYGQLGLGDLETPLVWNAMQIDSLTNVNQIAVGSEHNIALTGDGKIYCWGWNEHGNCGNGGKTDVKRPEELLLPYRYVGTLIGSGAGHSFAVVKKF